MPKLPVNIATTASARRRTRDGRRDSSKGDLYNKLICDLFSYFVLFVDVELARYMKNLVELVDQSAMKSMMSSTEHSYKEKIIKAEDEIKCD